MSKMGRDAGKHWMHTLIHRGTIILIFFSMPLIAAAQTQSAPGSETPGADLKWWVLVAVFLFAVIAGIGMFLLYYFTYPSVDDFQRFVYPGTAPSHDNPLLRSDTRIVYETVQHIVEAQNTSWNMYLQYTAAIVIALFLICIIILDTTQTITQAAFPIIATIVGAVIGNAIQPSRARTPQRDPTPAAGEGRGGAVPRDGEPPPQPPPPARPGNI